MMYHVQRDCIKYTAPMSWISNMYFSIQRHTQIWIYLKLKQWVSISSLRPSDAYLHQKTKPSMVQIIASCLASDKPLSKPMVNLTLRNNHALNCVLYFIIIWWVPMALMKYFLYQSYKSLSVFLWTDLSTWCSFGMSITVVSHERPVILSHWQINC